jgi:hypothetical protein
LKTCSSPASFGEYRAALLTFAPGPLGKESTIHWYAAPQMVLANSSSTDAGVQSVKINKVGPRSCTELVCPQASGPAVADALSNPAERLLSDEQDVQTTEPQLAGSAWHETGFVFTTETGEPCDPRNALRAFKTAAARAGIPHAGLHTLRHSAASVMLTNGVPLKVVSEILGHSSIAITGDVYGHVSPDVSPDAVRPSATSSPT